VAGPTPQDSRLPSLEPFIERVAAFIKVVGEGSLPLTIPFGPQPLELSASERRAVWRLLGDGSLPWTDWQAWIGLGTALHLAVASVFDALGLETSAATRARRLDAINEVAATVMEGLRQALAAMVLEGQKDDARRLSDFRNKLFEALAPLRAATASERPAPAPVEQRTDTVAEPVVEEAPPRFEASDPALVPCLERAAAFLRVRGDDGRPLTIVFGDHSFSLGAAERAAAWRSLCDGAPPASPWHQPLVEGLAVHLALLLTLEECERAGVTGPGSLRLREGLQADLRLAGGVLDRMREELERLVVGGQADDARRLTAFRNSLAATLTEARRVLAGESPAVASPDTGGDGAASPETAAAATGSDLHERLRAFRERAEDQLRLRGRESKPITISVGGQPWRLTGWERLVLWKTLCEEGPSPPPWAQALADAASAQLAVLEALVAISRAGSDEGARRRAEDAHAGVVALARETAEALEPIAAASAAEDKHELTEHLRGFQSKLIETCRLQPRS
jgi:hypothetical protein